MSGFLRNVIVLFIIGFCTESVTAIPSSYPSCRTRDICVRITECRSYMNLFQRIRRPLSPAALLFLRRQECGFDGSFPMVCCPPDTTNTQIKRDKVPIREEYAKPTFNPKSQSNYEKPDLTPVDLSDYRSAKTTTTTTEKVRTTTTRLSRRRPSPSWDISGSIKHRATQLSQRDERREELKKKREDLNRAFAQSAMDYFFVRRILDYEKDGYSNTQFVST